MRTSPALGCTDGSVEVAVKSYGDIVGDGGSAVLEQIRAQQEYLAQNLSGVRNLLVVGSG